MPIEYDRTAWYIRLYFFCATLQGILLDKPGELPEPRTNCAIMRMYFWGALSALALTAAVALFLLIVALVVALFVGVGVGVHRLAVHPPPLMEWLKALVFIAIMVGLGFLSQWMENRAPEPPKQSGTSFAEVVGQWLRDLDEKKCTPIVLK